MTRQTRSLSSIRARDIMKRNVFKLEPSSTIEDAVTAFTEMHISGAPVVDRSGKLIGVVSQTDPVRNERESSPRVAEVPGYFKGLDGGVLPKGFQVEAPDYTRVKDIMTPWTLSAYENTPIEELAKTMLRRHIHRIIIVKKDGKMAGIVTSLDLLRAVLSVKGGNGRKAKAKRKA